MSVSNICFCTYQGKFGLVREYKHGKLRVTFDDGDQWVTPTEINFI